MRCAYLLRYLVLPSALAFQAGHSNRFMHRPQARVPFSSSCMFAFDGEEDPTSNESELDELTPPSISFSRSSILFDPNPQTQRDNEPLVVWRTAKSVLPPFVTGAWDEKQGDTKPVEHLYNLIFVRMPTVVMALVYMKNLITGHPLIMSFGDGWFEVPSLLVFGIIALILR